MDTQRAAMVRVSDTTGVQLDDPGTWWAAQVNAAAKNEQHGVGPGGLFVNIAAVIDGNAALKAMPSVLARTDDKCLFYKGKVNLLFGDPETAKTWIALAAGAEVLCAGRRFVFIDMDHNGVDTTVERLHMLGIAHEVLADPSRFLYLEPEDKSQLCAAVGHLRIWAPDLALLDSVGELLPLMGASSNSNDEVTAAFRAVVAPLAKAGAAVVLIDHLAKNAESRRLGPVGAYGKTRIFNGAMVRVFRVVQFTPGQGGVSSLWIHKDRPGAVRRETAAPEADDDGDNDEIKRDNLRRWGVFSMNSTPVLDRGAPVLDIHGYALESLSWEILRPKGLRGTADGTDMPDPRKGGRPPVTDGVTVVGSPKYERAVQRTIVQLCKLKREGRIHDKTAMSRVRDHFIKGVSREPFSGAWERWIDANRPDNPTDVSPLTPVDPTDVTFMAP
ncbi:AAA family ATPase [Mycolicibacterium sp. Y3]